MPTKRCLAVWSVLLAAGAPLLAGQSIEVRGTVVTASGTAVPGARVELVPQADNFEVVGLLLARQTAPAATAATATDAAGRFALEAPGAGVFTVEVRAGGFVPMRMPLLPLAEDAELPPVAVKRSVTAGFSLDDDAGQPLVGAAVFARTAKPSPWDRSTSGGWEAASRIGWTDGEGHVTFPRARRERLDLVAIVPGSVESGGWQVVAGESHGHAGEKLTLTLRPSEPRTVEVRDARGGPISGAVVGAGDLAWPLGETDAAGRFELTAPRAASSRLHVFTERGTRRSGRLEPGGELLTLGLPEPAAFSGRVVDGSGKALAGALVWPAHDPGRFVVADVRGVFSLVIPATGRFRFQVHAPGYLPRAVTIEGGEPPPGDVALEAAGTVNGRVVDGKGAPLAGVRLAAVEPSPTPRPPVFRADRAGPGETESRAVSDPEGGFRLGQLRPGATYRVTAELAGFTTASVEIVELAAGERRGPLRLVLEAGRLLFGRVVDLEERPLAGAEVTLYSSAARSTAAPRPSVGAEGDALRAIADDTGRFEVRRAPASRIDLTARRGGFAPMTVRGLEVPPGQGAVDLGTLILGPGAAARGTVVDPHREPLAGAEIWAVEGGARLEVLAAAAAERGEPDAVAGADGGFEVPDLAQKREVDLLFDLPGFLPAAVTGVRAPAGDLVAVLQPAARVSGRVMADGDPAAGAEVRLFPRAAEPQATEEILGGGSRSAVADERGEFILEDVAPGRFELSAFAAGFMPSPELMLELEAAQEVDGLEIVLERGATLEGWVTDAGGAPVADAEVRAGRPSAASDGDGRYRLEGVPPGPATVRVEHPGYNRLARELDVEPGGQRVDFELAGGHPVAGRVVDEDELPVADVRIEIARELGYPEGLIEGGPRDLRRYRAASATNGSFRWPRVADGYYILTAEKQGYVVSQRAEGVEVAGAPVEDVEVVLLRGARIAGRILGLDFEDLARVEVRAESDGLRAVAGTVSYDGDYEIADLRPADWLVVARLRGGSRQADARVTLDPGVARARRDLEFQGLMLTGLVLRGGEPLAAAELSLNGRDVASLRAVAADSGGRFRLEDLRPGRYRLSVTHPREPIIHNQDVEVLSDRELLVEISAAALSGVVVSAVTGEPIADALVSLRQLLAGGGSLFTVGTDAAGGFRQDQLPPGSYRLRVRADGFEPIEQHLELSAALDGLEIPLAPTDGLDLVVRLASGQAPRFVHLAVLDAGGRPVAVESRVPEASGYVRFPAVPGGTWTLQVGAPGGAMRQLAAAVPSEVPLEVVLAAAGRLHVRVAALLETSTLAVLRISGSDGRPFRHLALGGELRGEWPVVAGAATVSEVPAGTWALRVTAPDGTTWQGTAITTGGPDVEALLE